MTASSGNDHPSNRPNSRPEPEPKHILRVGAEGLVSSKGSFS
jgi:hypothetical protein